MATIMKEIVDLSDKLGVTLQPKATESGSIKHALDELTLAKGGEVSATGTIMDAIRNLKATIEAGGGNGGNGSGENETSSDLDILKFRIGDPDDGTCICFLQVNHFAAGLADLPEFPSGVNAAGVEFRYFVGEDEPAYENMSTVSNNTPLGSVQINNTEENARIAAEYADSHDGNGTLNIHISYYTFDVVAVDTNERPTKYTLVVYDVNGSTPVEWYRTTVLW